MLIDTAKPAPQFLTAGAGTSRILPPLPYVVGRGCTREDTRWRPGKRVWEHSAFDLKYCSSLGTVLCRIVEPRIVTGRSWTRREEYVHYARAAQRT